MIKKMIKGAVKAEVQREVQREKIRCQIREYKVAIESKHLCQTCANRLKAISHHFILSEWGNPKLDPEIVRVEERVFCSKHSGFDKMASGNCVMAECPLYVAKGGAYGRGGGAL